MYYATLLLSAFYLSYHFHAYRKFTPCSFSAYSIIYESCTVCVIIGPQPERNTADGF